MNLQSKLHLASAFVKSHHGRPAVNRGKMPGYSVAVYPKPHFRYTESRAYVNRFTSVKEWPLKEGCEVETDPSQTNFTM